MVNTRIQRWAVLIAEYGAKIRYRKGKNNIRADMLSRIESDRVESLFWPTMTSKSSTRSTKSMRTAIGYGLINLMYQQYARHNELNSQRSLTKP